MTQFFENKIAQSFDGRFGCLFWIKENAFSDIGLHFSQCLFYIRKFFCYVNFLFLEHIYQWFIVIIGCRHIVAEIRVYIKTLKRRSIFWRGFWNENVTWRRVPSTVSFWFQTTISLRRYYVPPIKPFITSFPSSFIVWCIIEVFRICWLTSKVPRTLTIEIVGWFEI